MPLFRRSPKPVPGPRIDLRKPSPSTRPPDEDWSDEGRICAEWSSLDGADAARQSWSNGMALFEQGPEPAQLFNVAEYLSQGLAYTYVGQPVMPEERAAETVRRILMAISAMPSTVPAFQWQFVPKLVRLALAVARQKGWQPVSLGGDGRVGEDLLNADAIIDSIGVAGVAREEYVRHFFNASGAEKAP